MQKFNIGDEVWVARYSQNAAISVLCPICYGKLKVTLILGNGDSVELPCEYCGMGKVGGVPTGRVTEHQVVSSPARCTISGIEIEISPTEEIIRYRSESFVLYEDKTFATKEEAQEKGEELKEAREKEESTRIEYLKKDTKKSFSWNAGYHLSAVKRAERDLEYHRKKAVLCKARVKEEAQREAL